MCNIQLTDKFKEFISGLFESVGANDRCIELSITKLPTGESRYEIVDLLEEDVDLENYSKIKYEDISLTLVVRKDQLASFAGLVLDCAEPQPGKHIITFKVE
jgi:hypothetical protein